MHLRRSRSRVVKNHWSSWTFSFESKLAKRGANDYTLQVTCYWSHIIHIITIEICAARVQATALSIIIACAAVSTTTNLFSFRGFKWESCWVWWISYSYCHVASIGLEVRTLLQFAMAMECLLAFRLSLSIQTLRWILTFIASVNMLTGWLFSGLEYRVSAGQRSQWISQFSRNVYSQFGLCVPYVVPYESWFNFFFFCEFESDFERSGC